MIRHPEFVMLHLQKVAGTHLTKFLLSLYPDAKQEGLHGVLRKEDSDLFVFCGVRNPWDFYVSLFCYSKEKNSPPRTSFECRRELYEKTYLNEDEVEGFRNWLTHLMAGPVWDQNWTVLPRRWINTKAVFWRTRAAETIDGVYRRKMMQEAGLMTRWFCRLGMPDFRFQRFSTMGELTQSYEELGFVDDYFKLESLSDEILRIIKTHLPTPSAPDWEEQLHQWANQKTNTSSRLVSYRDYYTPELRDLVAKRDQWLIQKFDYSF